MTDKVTVSVNDLIALGGAALSLVALGFIHPALPVAGVGVGLSAFGWWRERHEPPDGGPGRPKGE